MPLYAVAIRKAINFGGFVAKWSNRYFAEGAALQDAIDYGNGVWEASERPFHAEIMFAYELYINQVGDAPETPGFTIPIAPGVQRGGRVVTIPPNTDSMLPLFNVVRVDFPVIASRPSRKFYRLPLFEQDITNAQLNTDLQALIQANVNEIAGYAASRDVDGQSFVGQAVVRGVTSRRLGRDSAQNVPAAPPFG